MTILIKNIKSLVQVEKETRIWVKGSEMKNLNCIEDAYLLIEDEKISDFGPMSSLSYEDLVGKNISEEIDATGKMVFPSWCDPHTHLVYAGSREGEFVDRINGLSYEEIAKRGGGILNSARKLHDTTEENLIESALKRLEEIKI